MKISCILIFITIFLAACKENLAYNHVLDRAEALMETSPDSAYSLLKSLDSGKIGNQKSEARYALLLSMALDKNYIDLCDFSVLQPAIDYYIDHGSDDEKQRTYYYQGRIFMNAGLEDKAMISFVNALDNSPNARDSLTTARALVAQALLYKNIYELDSFICNYLKAAELFGKKGDLQSQADCRLSAMDGCLILGKKDMSDSLYSESLKDYEAGYISEIDFLPYQMSYIEKYGEPDSLRRILKHAEGIEELSTDALLTIADSYYEAGDYADGLRVFDRIDSEKLESDSAKYFGIKAQLCEAAGRFEEATEYYKLFHTMLLRKDEKIFKNKLTAVEQLHRQAIDIEKNKRRGNIMAWGLWTGSIISALIITLLVLAIRNVRVKKNLILQRERIACLENRNLKIEQENLLHQIKELSEEKEELCEIIQSSQRLPGKVFDIVTDRFKALNRILAERLSDPDEGNLDDNTETARLLSNRERFMQETHEAFKITNPAFIRYFEEHGLTYDEINYVCLYAIGLKGKDVGAYLQRRGHVNTSSAIRKKLQIDKHETNIGKYVRRLLEQL